MMFITECLLCLLFVCECNFVWSSRLNSNEDLHHKRKWLFPIMKEGALLPRTIFWRREDLYLVSISIDMLQKENVLWSFWDLPRLYLVTRNKTDNYCLIASYLWHSKTYLENMEASLFMITNEKYYKRIAERCRLSQYRTWAAIKL